MKKSLLFLLTTVVLFAFSIQLLNATIYTTKRLDFNSASNILTNASTSYTITHADSVMRVVTSSPGQFDAMYWWVKTSDLTIKPYVSFSAKASTTTSITISLQDIDGNSISMTTSINSVMFNEERVMFSAIDLASINAASINQIVFNISGSATVDFEWLALGVEASPENHISTLGALGVTGYNLDPAFDASITSYIVHIEENTTTTPEITTSRMYPTSQIQVTQPIDITSTNLMDREAEILVTAEDGILTSTYKIYFMLDLGINENLQQITVYPNPASNILNISNTQSINKCSIMNITGSIMYTKPITSNNESVNISAFNPGIYFIQLWYDNDIVQTQKFVKK